jgi:ADP-ribose pyrophosphatase YjhB (NUDIX family)
VLDPEDRVLLFRYDDGPPNGSHWATPGGGLNDGEDFLTGARRELTEETGWTDVTVGDAVVLERIFPMGFAGEVIRQHEQIFLGRTEVPRRAIVGVDQMHASDRIAAWRWWALPELDTTIEIIWPRELPDLIRKMNGLSGYAATARRSSHHVPVASGHAGRGHIRGTRPGPRGDRRIGRSCAGRHNSRRPGR